MQNELMTQFTHILICLSTVTVAGTLAVGYGFRWATRLTNTVHTECMRPGAPRVASLPESGCAY